MDKKLFTELMEGANQMADHAADKKVKAVREVVKEVKPSLFSKELSSVDMNKKQKKIESTRRKMEDFDGFLQEFVGMDDRSTVIVAAARMDVRLGFILRKFLVDDEKNVEDLIGTEKPLGTFGAKVLALYCLGIFNGSQLRTLRAIAKIRNIFAHDLHGVTFETPEIAALCDKLENWHPSLPAPRSHPNNQFILAMFLQEAYLHELEIKTEKRERVPELSDDDLDDSWWDSWERKGE